MRDGSTKAGTRPSRAWTKWLIFLLMVCGPALPLARVVYAQGLPAQLYDPGFYQYRYQDPDGTGTLTITYDPNQPVPYILPSYMQMQVTLDYHPNGSGGIRWWPPFPVEWRGSGIIYDPDSSGFRRLSFSVTGLSPWDRVLPVRHEFEGQIHRGGYGGGTMDGGQSRWQVSPN
jgi:hypothetical protein